MATRLLDEPGPASEIGEAFEAPRSRPGAHRRLRPPRVESLFVAALTVFGFQMGARPIADNSTLMHLRTGVDIVRGLGIPRTDPYSFTAPGVPWVVQSWLAEWTYGLAYRLGGLHWVVLEQGLLTAVLAWLVARLARAGTALRTGLAATVAVGAGAMYWSPRPLLFGLIGLALTITVVERGRSPWWLLPIVWVWANTHGSFPLGLAWIACSLVGEWVDDRTLPRRTLRYGAVFVAGMALAALNPLGPGIISFAFNAGEKREVFRHIIEWASPDFQRVDGLVTLVFLAVGFVVLFRSRVPWRDLVPVVVFLVAGLLALRNLSALAIVMAPALARALRAPEPVGVPARARASSARPPRLNWAVLGVLGSLALLLFTHIVREPALNLHSYPVAVTDRLESRGLMEPGHRVATPDFAGNYLGFRYGRKPVVFIDDRYDMYPPAVAEDFHDLLKANPGALAALDRRDIDVVVWQKELPLVELLQASGRWQVTDRSRYWVVLERTAR